MEQYLNKGVGGSIPTEEAKKWIENFKNKNPPGETESHFFGSDIVDSILSQESCVGIRMCYALDEDGKKKLILVGCKEDGTYIWPSDNAKSTPSGITAGESWDCPPLCMGP